MPYPIEDKFVIGLASSALFDLGEAAEIFAQEGEDAYRAYQEAHAQEVLKPGIAFPFVRRLLHLNSIFPEEQPVEVILLSRNSPETGLRVFHSIQAYELDICRAAFFTGQSPYPYLDAFNASIFLSAHSEDVYGAIRSGYPAGLVIASDYVDNDDPELRLAFDFDAVLADDEAEQVYKSTGNLDAFHQHESLHRSSSLQPGPLKGFIDKIAAFQTLERRRKSEDPQYRRLLSTSIVTARSAPAHERMINTLKKWGVMIDHAFFLGGIEKRRILEVLRPHLFFDDQLQHLSSRHIPQVHIPFGIANQDRQG